jgi:hypothetical protein
MLIAARSSDDLVCCARATVSARSKYVSASRHHPPATSARFRRLRFASASYHLSPDVSTNCATSPRCGSCRQLRSAPRAAETSDERTRVIHSFACPRSHRQSRRKASTSFCTCSRLVTILEMSRSASSMATTEAPPLGVTLCNADFRRSSFISN